mgnify:CR=1 FL=1
MMQESHAVELRQMELEFENMEDQIRAKSQLEYSTIIENLDLNLRHVTEKYKQLQEENKKKSNTIQR